MAHDGGLHDDIALLKDNLNFHRMDNRARPLFKSTSSSRCLSTTIQGESAMAPRDKQTNSQAHPSLKLVIFGLLIQEMAQALHADLEGGREERRRQAGDSHGGRQADIRKMGQTDPKASPRSRSSLARGRRSPKDVRRDPHAAMCRVPAATGKLKEEPGEETATFLVEIGLRHQKTTSCTRTLSNCKTTQYGG